MKTLLLIVLLMIISALANHFRLGFDDTDDLRPGRFFGARSGLTVYTDHKTGVQYVKAGLFGTTVPRLDRNGRPIIKEQQGRSE